ncbi:MAG: WD40 repeat domain-containing protein, partial [Minisyncoccia bacterium]
MLESFKKHPEESKTPKEKRREIKGWKLKGELKKENILLEFKTNYPVNTANFSPEGDKIVIGSRDGVVRVISLTEKEDGEPKALAGFNIGDAVYAANFSPEGDKIVIGSRDGVVRVISLT